MPRYPISFPAVVLAVVPTLPGAAAGQVTESPRALGLTAQVYPAGVIARAHVSFAAGGKGTLAISSGYNVTDRRDFGEHDNEEGGGPGFGIAGRWYLEERYDGFHLGLRTDLWFLEIDWEDDAGPRAGTTDIVVLQPTAQAGYSHALGGGRFVLDATVSLGAEVNVRTRGEAVGEGAILLGGVGIAYRF